MLIKYKYNPIEAYQWFKNGDHPRDNCELITPEDGEAFLSEGKVVRRFNSPKVNGDLCGSCNDFMYRHGWIDQYGDDLLVCPCDWVLNDLNMRYTVEFDELFKEMFEEYSPGKALDTLLSDGNTKVPLY